MPAQMIISDEEVREMRGLFDGSNHRQLATKFGVSPSYALAIVYYRSRKAAGPPRETITYYISDGIGGRPKGLGVPDRAW
jgi:hypothetical protein